MIDGLHKAMVAEEQAIASPRMARRWSHAACTRSRCSKARVGRGGPVVVKRC